MNGQDAANAAMANFQQSPGYQYQFNEGMRAVQSNAAAQGMLNSGATLKALQDRGQQLGNLSFQTYYNNLMGFVNGGQASAAGQATASGNAGAGLAQTAASAGMAQANVYGNAAQGIGNTLNTKANYDAYENAMQKSMYGQQTNALMNGYGNPQQSAINSGNYAYGAGGYTGQGPYLGG